jgi:hypothetical protein
MVKPGWADQFHDIMKQEKGRKAGLSPLKRPESL